MGLCSLMLMSGKVEEGEKMTELMGENLELFLRYGGGFRRGVFKEASASQITTKRLAIATDLALVSRRYTQPSQHISCGSHMAFPTADW